MYPFMDALGGLPCVAMGIGNASEQVHAPNENIKREHFARGVALLEGLAAWPEHPS